MDFEHPSRCPECVVWIEECLVISQGGGELSDGETHDGVYSYLFLVLNWKNLIFGSTQNLSFVKYLRHLLLPVNLANVVPER